jgi:hypothetical protein
MGKEWEGKTEIQPEKAGIAETLCRYYALSL